MGTRVDEDVISSAVRCDTVNVARPVLLEQGRVDDSGSGLPEKEKEWKHRCLEVVKQLAWQCDQLRSGLHLLQEDLRNGEVNVSASCANLFPQTFRMHNLPSAQNCGSGAKCSKPRELIAIAIYDSNRESQITIDLRECEPSQKGSLH